MVAGGLHHLGHGRCRELEGQTVREGLLRAEDFFGGLAGTFIAKVAKPGEASIVEDHFLCRKIKQGFNDLGCQQLSMRTAATVPRSRRDPNASLREIISSFRRNRVRGIT